MPDDLSIPTKAAEAEDTIRVQFEISKSTFEIYEKVFEKMEIRGHHAQFIATAGVFKRLAEEQDYVLVKLLPGGVLDFAERTVASILEGNLPLGHASKATRLEHGMQPTPE